jgi:ATP/maltotriose-dependent transcriptional regulator MalT
MNSEEINRILSFQTCKIVAPAGHGKTEMISQLVLLSEGT